MELVAGKGVSGVCRKGARLWRDWQSQNFWRTLEVDRGKGVIMDRDRERESEEDDTSLSRADAANRMLKTIARYALIGFAPVMSVAALIVGIIAMSNHQLQADYAKLSELTSTIAGLNTSLAATRAELENLKFTLSREKAMRGEERKKLDDRVGTIVENVTLLQVKLKVAPTLEAQLREAASSPAAVSPVANTAPALTVAPPVETKPVVNTIRPASPPAKAASTPPKPKSQKQISDKAPDQVKVLKQAIDQFNKQ